MTHTNQSIVKSVQPIVEAMPDLSKVVELTEDHREEVTKFLAVRPVHTVVMSSFINDNGMESPQNRGKFFGYRNTRGELEGVALIGHSTLVEARTENAIAALAMTARTSETPIHLVMSSGERAEIFWNYYTGGTKSPRLTCKELLFEVAFPYMVQNCEWNIRKAESSHLEHVAAAQAEIAFVECGVDPMEKDRAGFLKRVQKRIDQGRVFVVFENGKLLFKADIIAEANDVIYLEGIYVAPELRGQGMGSRCLSKLSLDLMGQAGNICLLSNVDFEQAHRSYTRAGFKQTDSCTTLFA